MSYDGYLRSLLPEIVASWRAGKSFKEIADQLRGRTPRYHWAVEPACSANTVRYALAKAGYIHAPGLIRTPEIPPRKYIARWDLMFPPSNRGRPIDMGGPRDVWIDADPWSAPLMAKSAKPKSDAAQDKALVRRGVAQHETALHRGKPKTKLKLGKGGK